MCRNGSFACSLIRRLAPADLLRFCAVLLACNWTLPADAQQVSTTTPLRSNSSGYSEGIGVGWGLRGPGFFFNMNNPAVPPFGGYVPGTGANLGWGFQNGRTSGFFNLNASQGFSASNSMVSGSVTSMNGMPGSIAAGSITPFVVGVTPVVGNAPIMPMPVGPAFVTPLQERLSRINEAGGVASATVPRQAKPAAAAADHQAPAPPVSARNVDLAGSFSLDEIKAFRAKQEQAADAELQSIIAKARASRDAGKPSVARIYYQQAIRRANGAVRTSLEAELNALP